MSRCVGNCRTPVARIVCILSGYLTLTGSQIHPRGMRVECLEKEMHGDTSGWWHLTTVTSECLLSVLELKTLKSLQRESSLLPFLVLISTV